MQVKFDFEVDERFNYEFSDTAYSLLDPIRILVTKAIEPFEQDLIKYTDGVFVIIVSDVIKVLKELNFPPRKYQTKVPNEILEKIRTRMPPSVEMGLQNWIGDIH